MLNQSWSRGEFKNGGVTKRLKLTEIDAEPLGATLFFGLLKLNHIKTSQQLLTVKLNVLYIKYD